MTSSSSSSSDNLFLKAMIAGNVCAGVSALLNPFDVTKIRMQNQSKSNGIVVYKGMIDGAFSILREEGFIGWCRGMTPSMFREITYSSIRLGAYEPIRNILNNMSSNKDTSKTSPFVRFSAALITGGVGAAIANPLDLIKTRFQACLPTEQRPYKNTFDAFRKIYIFS